MYFIIGFIFCITCVAIGTIIETLAIFSDKIKKIFPSQDLFPIYFGLGLLIGALGIAIWPAIIFIATLVLISAYIIAPIIDNYSIKKK
jgi:hypothetical protein